MNNALIEILERKQFKLIDEINNLNDIQTDYSINLKKLIDTTQTCLEEITKIILNPTKMFHIESESGRKSIMVKIEYESDDLMTSGTVKGAICAFGYATNYGNIQVTEVKNG